MYGLCHSPWAKAQGRGRRKSSVHPPSALQTSIVQMLSKPNGSQRAFEPQSVNISHRAQSRAELVRGGNLQCQQRVIRTCLDWAYIWTVFGSGQRRMTTREYRTQGVYQMDWTLCNRGSWLNNFSTAVAFVSRAGAWGQQSRQGGKKDGC